MPQLYQTVDIDVVTAAKNYVKYGLHPGSCCVQILLGDFEGAAQSCHPVALAFLPATFEVVRLVVPAEARDSVEAIERWIERGRHQCENTED